MQKPFSAHRLLTLAALLAALPAAAAPNNITDLGTLKNDNSGSSSASAISANGRTVVGSRDSGGSDSRAVVWSGGNWATKTDLGTLRADNSGWAVAKAISDDGSIVVGAAAGYNPRSNAVVWSGSGWSTKTDLNLPHFEPSTRDSEANGVSGDGSVVVGLAYTKFNDDKHAVVWSGSNWASQTDLGTLKADNSGFSSAYATNRDGSVVVGSATDGNDQRATVWSGSNWGTKTDLGTLRSDNLGSSIAVATNRDGSVVVGTADSNDNNVGRATVWSGSGWGTKTKLDAPEDSYSFASSVSADGSVIGGWFNSNNGFYKYAVVWSGSNWGTKTELGTLKSDNSGSSEVYGLSADGNFAVGEAENDDYVTRAVVWNLRSLNIRAADTANTRASLSLLSADTAAMLAQRARAAENLLGGCRADGGKFCYSAGYRRDIGHGASSRGADFAFGYGFTDNFDAAVSLAVPARAEENGSHRLKSGVGIGLSARLHNGAGWYAVPAAAFETDKTRIRRPHLNGTESPENTVRTKGRAYSLTAGRDYGTPGEKTLGWYAALRRTEAERPSYSEDAGLSFPFAYGAAKLKETSLAAGIKGRLPLTGKLAWYGNAEVAQRVGGGKARFTAEAPFFGKYETERETARTRPSVQTGVDYAFSPSAVLSLGGYIGRNAFSGTDKGMFLKLNGKF